MVVVLLVAQAGLLLEAPSYFPAYAGFVVPAAALTLAAASGRIAAWLAEHGMVLRVAGVAALSAAVAAAGMALVPIRVGSGRPFLGSQLGAFAGQERCVLSDTPIVLIEMNVLSRDLRNGCPLHPDVTGYTYEGELRARSPGPGAGQTEEPGLAEAGTELPHVGERCTPRPPQGHRLGPRFDARNQALARPGPDRRLHPVCARADFRMNRTNRGPPPGRPW